MAFHPPAILSFLCLAFAATQATLPGEVYWNSLLPNTTMPRAISNVLLPGNREQIVPDLRRSGYQRSKRTHYTLDNQEDGEVVPDLRCSGYQRSKRTHYTLDNQKDGEVVPDLRRSGYQRSKRNKYGLSSEKNDVLVNPPSAPWFLEDLYPGKEMEMEIARPENDGYVFVPRKVADTIPFSSVKFTTILDKLSIKPESVKAELMKATLKECELPAEEGEVKTCATSLESMIDFSIEHLGKHIQAVSTEAEKDTKLQKFTMLKGIEQIGQTEAVACHKQNYVYAVFYCHDVKGARSYVVPFVGTSGTKVKAVGVCHTNTTTWSPEHEAFKILKVKPGGEPICHFLPEYNVLWTRK